jgi:LTXXQ motif family protein
MKTTLLLKPMRLNAFNRSLAFTAMILGLGAMPATSVHAQPVPGVAMTGEPAMGVHEMHAMQGMHPGPMDPARLEKMWQHRLERFDAHLERMKKRLELTPAQEGAWTQFASAIRPSKPGSVPLSPPQWRETMQLKAPERMEKRVMRRWWPMCTCIWKPSKRFTHNSANHNKVSLTNSTGPPGASVQAGNILEVEITKKLCS